MSSINGNIASLLEHKNYKCFIRNAGKFKFPPNYKFEMKLLAKDLQLGEGSIPYKVVEILIKK